MTRHTVSHAPLADRPCETDELARVASTAAALIELAVQESHTPVDTLGRALARIADSAPEAAAELRAELAVCIESLQFHDRMVQQLTQVRDLLAGATAARPVTTDRVGWPTLRERLRAHFTSESHRMLFNLLMPGENDGPPVHLHAEEGSVELF